jgi:hypothetical protein
MLPDILTSVSHPQKFSCKRGRNNDYVTFKPEVYAWIMSSTHPKAKFKIIMRMMRGDDPDYDPKASHFMLSVQRDDDALLFKMKWLS